MGRSAYTADASGIPYQTQGDQALNCQEQRPHMHSDRVSNPLHFPVAQPLPFGRADIILPSKIRKSQHWYRDWVGVFWFAGFCLFAAAASYEHVSAQSAYNLQVIARTGDTTPAGTITALGTGPSINDAGKVAYVVSVQDGRQGVFVSGEAGARSTLIDTFSVGFSTFSGLAQNFYFPDVVQINNRNQIAWKVWSRDGLFSFIFRLGSSAADFKIVAKTL